MALVSSWALGVFLPCWGIEQGKTIWFLPCLLWQYLGGVFSRWRQTMLGELQHSDLASGTVLPQGRVFPSAPVSRQGCGELFRMQTFLLR